MVQLHNDNCETSTCNPRIQNTTTTHCDFDIYARTAIDRNGCNVFECSSWRTDADCPCIVQLGIEPRVGCNWTGTIGLSTRVTQIQMCLAADMEICSNGELGD